MKVEVIENRKHTCLLPMAQGVLAGSAVGLIAKYACPLNNDEKNSNYYKENLNQIKTQELKYGSFQKDFVDSIKAKKNKSLAEDTFVKMFNDTKKGAKLSFENKDKLISTLKEKNPDFVSEFNGLFKEFMKIAENVKQKSITALNFAMKQFRPINVFLVGGAVVGAIIALLHDVIRTDVKH